MYSSEARKQTQCAANSMNDLVEQFDARPNEVKALFSNTLDPARAAELRDRILAAGLPI